MWVEVLKVLNLIGEERERKFLSKNVLSSTSTSTSMSVLPEKLEWDNLMEFLNKELTLREKLTLIQKSKTCLGITPGSKPSRDPRENKKDKSTFYGDKGVKPKLKCHICDKNDHDHG